MKANSRHSGILLVGIQKTAWMPVFTGMTDGLFKPISNHETHEKLERISSGVSCIS